MILLSSFSLCLPSLFLCDMLIQDLGNFHSIVCSKFFYLDLESLTLWCISFILVANLSIPVSCNIIKVIFLFEYHAYFFILVTKLLILSVSCFIPWYGQWQFHPLTLWKIYPTYTHFLCSIIFCFPIIIAVLF